MGRAFNFHLFQAVDVIGRPTANKERINGASLKAAGSLLPGHSLITVSLAFALIGENKGRGVEWSEWRVLAYLSPEEATRSCLTCGCTPHLQLFRSTHTEPPARRHWTGAPTQYVLQEDPPLLCL